MSKPEDSRSIETRDQLIQAAIELFGLVGYDGTSTRAISSKAGASLGAIP
ncbi:MAG: TetR family transcriptional regulator, partial [Hyphomonas sp. 32-62-5]